MSKFLFIELPDGFKELDTENAVERANWKFIEGEDEAQKEAEKLGLPWPIFIARNESACVFTVYESNVKDLSEYARETIRREVELRKNPPEVSSGCGCGMLGGGCGCGSSCRCGK